MKLTIRIVLICCLLAAAASAQQVEVSASYLYQGSNHVPGASDWFNVNGGRADASFGGWRHTGLAAEFSGVHSSNMAPGTGLTMFTYMAGPRRTLPVGPLEKHKVSVFAQVLVGGVHASEGLFPKSGSFASSADAFALSAGGGVEARLTRQLSLRLVQADYLYTRLPNLNSNYESNLRLGAGVAYRFH